MNADIIYRFIEDVASENYCGNYKHFTQNTTATLSVLRSLVFPVLHMTPSTPNFWSQLTDTEITSRSFPHSWLVIDIVTRVTRRVSLVEQQMFTPIISGVRVTRSLVFCVVFCRSLFVHLSYFFLAIVLSVLRLTDSDYSFGTF